LNVLNGQGALGFLVQQSALGSCSAGCLEFSCTAECFALNVLNGPGAMGFFVRQSALGFLLSRMP